MASSNVTYQSVAIKYGILVGVAHIAYFLLMWAFGLLEIVELSFLSGFLLVIGIVVAISKLKRVRAGDIRYLEGLGLGATVGVVSSGILAVFLAIFLSSINTDYIQSLQASALFPEGLSVLTVIILTIVYGTVPGLLIGFIAMQWFKREDHNTMPGQR